MREGPEPRDRAGGIDAGRKRGMAQMTDTVSDESERMHLRVVQTAGDRINGVVPARRQATPAREGPEGREGQVPGFVYRPMWDIKRKLLSTYLCLPADPLYGNHAIGVAGAATGNGVLPPAEAQDAATAALDVLALRQAIRDLESGLRDGRRALIGCTVHFNTLRDPGHRARFLAVCRTIGPASRKHLILEIALSGDDARHLRAIAAVCALDTFCSARLVRLPLNRPSFGALERLPIHAVGLDLGAGAAPERHLEHEIKGFVANANRAGLRSYIRGLDSVALASAAVCAGFDYADGDVVGGVTDAPGRVAPYDVSDLLRRSVAPPASQVVGAD